MTSNCFPGSSLVLLESGSYVPLADIKVGDRILSADGLHRLSYSEVVALPHGRNEYLARFVHLATETSPDGIYLTHMHRILAKSTPQSSEYNVVTAASVKAGHCIALTLPNGSVECSLVTYVDEVLRKGLYSAVTLNEFIVVDGFIVSPYAVDHAMAHSLYDAYRRAYVLLPWLFRSQMLISFSQFIAYLVMAFS